MLVSGDAGYDANVQHGLIAATENQSGQYDIRWYNGTYLSVGTGAAIGTGSANTDAIIAAQGAIATSYAAGLARAYTGGGYTDWYLPSINELQKLYLSKAAIGFSDYPYWSSSEKDGTNSLYAWYLNFTNGSINSGFNKYTGLYVRAVRSF